MHSFHQELGSMDKLAPAKQCTIKAYRQKAIKIESTFYFLCFEEKFSITTAENAAAMQQWNLVHMAANPSSK